MATELPKVIMTDYHDGVTEGLIRSVDSNPFFFKLIAWDDQQDKRVFALKEVDTRVYEEIANLLEDAAKTGTLKPIWLFSDKKQSAKAEKLLESCHFESSIDFLVLGDQIDKKVKVITPKPEIVERIIESINNNKIDSIESLLKLFEATAETEL